MWYQGHDYTIKKYDGSTWSYVSTIFKDNSADKLHSGTYFYQLEIGDMRVVKRMFVIK